MTDGVYELILSTQKRLELQELKHSRRIQTGHLDGADSHDCLALHLYRACRQALSMVKGHDKEKVGRQIHLCNLIIDLLDHEISHDLRAWSVDAQGQQLLEILASHAPKMMRPDTPLSFGALLTGTRLDPPLHAQLSKEISSCRKVDILCSFIKWSGIRILLPALEEFTKRSGSRLRIITTTYMGATDLKALQELSKLPNTEIRVSYDSRKTRLHAKAYILKRNSDFSAAYIGSSNISYSAMTDGLEWNVKISCYEQPYLWNKVCASFETYWADQEFEDFADGEKFSRTLDIQRRQEEDPLFFDLRPYPFQQEILETLETERRIHGRSSHLVASATGTGKTMVAAFDYQSWSREFKKRSGREAKLLFIAHREEILKQSVNTFRGVLKDRNFGELYTGKYRPEHYEHLFCSIQTYRSRKLHEVFPPDYFDYIVVDEFHRAAAPSYLALLTRSKPSIFLGLTATPERHDDNNILKWFGNHISAEIRLPDAVSRNLLCTFQYFGITDGVDYSRIAWRRGGYDEAELSKILDADGVRASLAAQKAREILLDVRSARGLGFCVSKNHARFMAQVFTRMGIPSESLTADSKDHERNTVQQRLKSRELNFIFTVDLYNEGVDIPEVDTVLFLRPTKSLTVFLQQLGRGLRISEGKECLTVIDFIGQCHAKFRFDLRFSALLAGRTGSLKQEVASGFPHLPHGCSIQLERIAQKYVLENITKSITTGRRVLVDSIRDYAKQGEVTLEGFMEEHHLSMHDIYKRGLFSRLCAEAGVIGEFQEPDETLIAKSIRRILHINDYTYLQRLIQLLSRRDIEEISDTDRRYLTMFLPILYGDQKKRTPQSTVYQLRKNPEVHREVLEVLELLKKNTRVNSPEYALPFLCPLQVHAEYRLDEILAAFGYSTWNTKKAFREGVLYLKELETDLFFVTLNKKEHQYSPTTLYDDYAVNQRMFHWQSQAGTASDSPTAKRYRNKGQRILLFVREEKVIDQVSQPYCFLGPVTYFSDEGSKPISFLWSLHFSMPAFLLKSAKKLAAP